MTFSSPSQFTRWISRANSAISGKLRKAISGGRYQESGIREGNIWRAVSGKQYQGRQYQEGGNVEERRFSAALDASFMRALAPVAARAAPLLATPQSKLLHRVNARWTQA
jgi:hypothetical protein